MRVPLVVGIEDNTQMPVDKDYSLPLGWSPLQLSGWNKKFFLIGKGYGFRKLQSRKSQEEKKKYSFSS